jgi:glyoxylase-like metal-dependent hydrolase (beta-lactamase superfamily II)
MAATGGRLLANLAAAGIDPASIESVLLTHMHPDHSAGLTDMTTGKLNFPNAELVMHENEPRHWFDDAAMAKGDDREKKLFFQAGREQTDPYRKQWRLFQGGEVLPGVTAMPFHGHTPGHTGYLLNSGGESLLIWGDIVHVPEVQTARPEVCMAFDTDKAQAEATRRKVFDMVATDRLMVTGMHLHFPGFTHLVRQGTGYRLIPMAWEQSL